MENQTQEQLALFKDIIITREHTHMPNPEDHHNQLACLLMTDSLGPPQQQHFQQPHELLTERQQLLPLPTRVSP